VVGVSEEANGSLVSRRVDLDFLRQVFAQLDRNGDGLVTIAEAESALLRINSRLNRSYGEDEVKALFDRVDTNQDGVLSFEEFYRAMKVFF
jgi:Ca2+-binding EF-hand superfamily protein